MDSSASFDGNHGQGVVSGNSSSTSGVGSCTSSPPLASAAVLTPTCSGSTDIFQKLSAILDSSTSTSSSSPHLGAHSSRLSPDSSAFYPANHSNLLGLANLEVNKRGEYKFADVSSPLNKILSKSVVEENKSSLGTLSGFGTVNNNNNNQKNPKIPNYSPGNASFKGDSSPPGLSGVPPGFGRKSDSSEDEDAGYGTSYGSASSANRTIRKDGGGNIELNDLMKCLSSTPFSPNYGPGMFDHPQVPRHFRRLNSSQSPLSAHHHQQQQQQQQQVMQAVLNNWAHLNLGQASNNPNFDQIVAAATAAAAAHFANSPQAGFSGPRFPNNNNMTQGPQMQTPRYYGQNEMQTHGSPLERAAKIYSKKGTAMYDASCTWSGQLPARKMSSAVLSQKVFLGGVPWDITEPALAAAFSKIGQIKVEWPGKENHAANNNNNCQNVVPKGYLYIIFEESRQVEALLNACTKEAHTMMSQGGCGQGNNGPNNDTWYFKISSRRMRHKEVQVIPWVVGDSNHVNVETRVLDSQKTVFVGALHGMMTAEGLCKIFDDLFGGVVYSGIDTDKWKYPIGSGRVTFDNPRSYMKAVAAAFIEIKTAKFSKKVQVDPYLEDALCSACGLRQGPYFCREVVCFKYYCRVCWESHHQNSPDGIYRHHKPLMRNSSKSNNNNNSFNNFNYTQPPPSHFLYKQHQEA